jgi:formyltetrahydrofolate hydrolase
MSVHLEGKPHYILNATCDSRLGTVAAVSGFLASRQCYITEMQQFDDILSGRFFVRVNFFGEPGRPLASTACASSSRTWPAASRWNGPSTTARSARAC